eukprot:CAMPEP_0181539092 /NCGR_PEP_ID=MMETSP1110-20121109/76201_1 /TAXON_ID=174948 /ORGANISM="Symbiodinium sp., Strain CCMP421" /LENGTH=412 /DNA_ID=CAMNT_0023670709 /DNA_START=62 /DNA_END=1301 /DNA_ORIENTATION=-
MEAVLGSFPELVGIDGAVAPKRSLAWLWQTVAATCCWALSDVICDACIRPPAADAAGDTTESEDVGTMAKPGPSPEPTSLRQRRRPDALGEAVETDSREGKVTLRRITSPRLRPCTQLMPEVPALDWSLDGDGKPEELDRLTPEQNALVSGCVVNLGLDQTGSGWCGRFFSFHRVSLHALCFHFCIKHGNYAIDAALRALDVAILHICSFAWACAHHPADPPGCCAADFAGGFLPAADGCLSSVATGKFWQQRAVRYVVTGELLICCYNVLLHQATFEEPGLEPSTTALAPFQFFLISRVANGLTCAALFLAIPSLRSHLWALRKVKRRFFAVALLGEVLSMIGVCLVTFSYSGFYEPSVVNAVEGGLQQLFNLIFAIISHRLLGLGRGVEQVPVKCASLLLVSIGLALSTT